MITLASTESPLLGGGGRLPLEPSSKGDFDLSGRSGSIARPGNGSRWCNSSTGETAASIQRKPFSVESHTDLQGPPVCGLTGWPPWFIGSILKTGAFYSQRVVGVTLDSPTLWYRGGDNRCNTFPPLAFIISLFLKQSESPTCRWGRGRGNSFHAGKPRGTPDYNV